MLRSAEPRAGGASLKLSPSFFATAREPCPHSPEANYLPLQKLLRFSKWGRNVNFRPIPEFYVVPYTRSYPPARDHPRLLPANQLPHGPRNPTLET